jgi:formylglycine-generating enzyme required for sulfatase activity
MVLIRGGLHRLGSLLGDEDERPVHEVLLDPYYIDATEVTNEDFIRFVEATGYVSEGNWRDYVSPLRARHPVVAVTWADATAFAAWAGKRLPTEAEWEAAAAGGRDTPYPNGENITPAAATFGAVTGTDQTPATTPVASHPPNNFGLYDMAGNAWEWCSDYYAADAYSRRPRRNPKGPERGSSRVCRGGSWYDRAESLRVANRLEMTPAILGNVFGFRCVADP